MSRGRWVKDGEHVLDEGIRRPRPLSSLHMASPECGCPEIAHVRGWSAGRSVGLESQVGQSCENLGASLIMASASWL